MNQKAFIRHYILGGITKVQIVDFTTCKILEPEFDSVDAARSYALDHHIVLVKLDNHEIIDPSI